MKLLILGGTRFPGRHLADAARADGVAVSLFNRGRTAPDLFADVERLHGDRDGGLDALGGGTWDVVIDTSGYVARVVRQSVERQAAKVGRYVFVSSVSAYRDLSGASIVEDAPVLRLRDPATEDVLPNYGALKAACESVVQETFAARSLIIRPGLIVGPHDPTERFPYWVRRCARGGPMLVPDAPGYPIQFIDVRDLARWMVAFVQRDAGGVFNAVGPRQAADAVGIPGVLRERAGNHRVPGLGGSRFSTGAGRAALDRPAALGGQRAPRHRAGRRFPRLGGRPEAPAP